LVTLDCGVGAALAHPRVGVIICAYTERRWDLLVAAVESVKAQRPLPDELALVIDHNDALLARARAAFPDVQVMANEEARGLSGARNTGVRHTQAELLAFLDDDARAEPEWLADLVEALRQPAVLGAGGIATPAWEGRSPAWMPPEFLWVVGASYTGLPRDKAPVRNPIGANMAFRREAFELVGGFTDGIGRIGRIPLGCEETEFAIRVRQAAPGSMVMHVPQARVSHHVPADRVTWRYFCSRCWAEGASKAMVTARVGSDGLASERSYVARTLPRGVLAGLRAAGRGDPGGLGRVAAIFIGTGLTVLGLVRGRLASRSRPAEGT
jgi:GT2 family glycosyltransferase